MRLFTLGLVSLALGIVSCGEDDKAFEAGGFTVAEAEIGPEGGELVGTYENGFPGFKLTVPPGAIAAKTKVSFTASFDETPLPFRAERVGPMVTLQPKGLALTAPARLTVPSDLELRAQYEDQDADCKVWAKGPEGWARREPVATGQASVTVEITTLDAAAAGVVFAPKAPSCGALCGQTVVIREELPCEPATGYCVTPVRDPDTRLSFVHFAAVANDNLYWGIATSPATGDTLSIARFPIYGDSPTVTRTSEHRSSHASFFRRLEVSGNGKIYAPISVAGNGLVEFQPEAGPLTKAFDTGSNVHGISLDGEALGARVIDFRVTNGATNGLAIANKIPSGVVQLAPVPASGANTARSTGAGDFFFVNTFAGACRAGMTGAQTFCQPPDGALLDGQPFGASAVSGRGKAAVTTASFASGRKVVVLDNKGKGPVLRTFATPTSVAAMAFDEDGETLFAVSGTRAELYIMTPDGGLSTFLLSNSDPASDQYAAMIPRNIFHIRGKNEHLLVVKGNANQTGQLRRFRKLGSPSNVGKGN